MQSEHQPVKSPVHRLRSTTDLHKAPSKTIAGLRATATILIKERSRDQNRRDRGRRFRSDSEEGEGGEKAARSKK
ncbi:hypothetical protein L484_021425 [Morus notabilis]|uniref:Uncharacterized protein n=1 Tax=Morus notabilis TaxID=981085 RepID=W9S062_9ROSA|nr:hypothetical protein L484_021425 [Morus notabilis]